MAITIKARPGTPQTMDATDQPTFAAWLKRVNGLLFRHVGLAADDLEDCPWMRWYGERVRPIWAANRALKRAGGDYF